MSGFVLVGGWPAAGKTTLARALASELEFAYLSKDEVKEGLMDALGRRPLSRHLEFSAGPQWPPHFAPRGDAAQL